jgi:two-component system, NarL family, response regulator DevR
MSTEISQPIRVVLVDDHQMVRVGLKTLLEGFPRIQVVGEAATAAEAPEVVSQSKPDVVLLDIRLPDGSGLEVCRQLRKAHRGLRVLMLTSYYTDDMVMDAIEAGAEGYLLKEINADFLVRSIQEVLEGKSILDPAVTRKVIDRVREGKSGDSKPSLDLLSPQERRVIALVAEGKTNKEIGVELKLSDKTVKNYLSNLMEKLNFTRRSQAAVFFAQHSPRPNGPIKSGT